MFALREDSLEITSYPLGRKCEAQIPIRSISPDYELHSGRAWRAVVILLMPVAVSIALYRWLLHHPNLPDMLLQFPLYFGAVFAFAAFRLYPRFEAFVFKNHFNRPLFTILRESGQRAECEAFIHALLDRIETLGSDREATPLTAAIADEDAAKADDTTVARWKLAIGLSAVSLGVPPVVDRFWPELDFLLVPLVVVCSGGAVVAAIYSFMQKESGRWWSIAAAILALVPVLFY